MQLLLLLLLPVAVRALPRGVDPTHAAAYEEGPTFKCLDDSRTIPYSRVNDNYCDCLTDGSDEPGTSACYNGKLYCGNRGHAPHLLPSAFVDDGICDCCDGADEAPGFCPHTCLDKGATERQQVREGVERMRRSLALKQSLVEQGAQRRQGWGLRKATLQQELHAQQQEVTRLEEEKKQKEAAAEADRQRIRTEQQEAERQRQAEAAAAQKQQDEEQAQQQQQDATADATPEGGAELVEETAEERGRRIASQWTTDPDAAAVDEHHADGEDDDAHHDGEHHDEYNHYNDQHQQAASQNQYVYTPLDNDVHQVNTQLESAKRRVGELEEEQRVIERYHSSGLTFDYGPSDLFASLAGRCLADVGQRWTYEACFFEHAVQKEPHNPSNRVSLGNWHGWNKDYTEALFTGGDACAGGVTRSLTVRLVCEEAERMWGGEEPATCVYAVWMATPLACRQSDLQQELSKLEALDKFEAEVRAEIEAAGKLASATSANTHTEL